MKKSAGFSDEPWISDTKCIDMNGIAALHALVLARKCCVSLPYSPSLMNSVPLQNINHSPSEPGEVE